MRMLQRELDPVGYDRARRRAERSPTENAGTSARDLLNELGDLAKGSPASIKIDMAGHKGLPTVWFNAWIYQSGKQIWAGLGEAIIRGLSERLEEAMSAKGREVKDLDIALFGAPPDIDKLRGRIEQGFDHLIFNLPAADADTVLPLLDQYAELANQARG